MEKICGVELKGAEAIIVLLSKEDEDYIHVDIEPRKIKLGDDESSDHIQSFFDSFQNFIRQHNIELVVIKKRAHKGPKSGGAVSFKMESLVQLNGISDVVFESGQGIAAAEKKIPFSIPQGLNKYQEIAFKSAMLHIRKNYA